MTGPSSVRFYRWVLRCYPRVFREEYGPDMVALLEHQLRDEHPLRVWTRLVVDLAVTVPARHLEVQMNRPPNFILPALFAGLSTAGVVIVVIGGAGGATLASGAALASISGALAVLTWRDTCGVATGRAADHWWKFLAAGAAGLLAFVVVTSITGEVSSRVWPLAMVALVVALALISTGVILAVTRIARARYHATR